MLLGRLRRPGVPPRGLRLVFRLAQSPRLLLLELFASFTFRVAALAGLLFGSSCTCLVSSGTAASWMLTGFSSWGTEWMFSFGRSSSSVSYWLPASLMGGWCGSLGACLPFFPLPFPLESLSLHGSWSGFCRGSPLRVVSSCGFLRVACLRSGGGGFWLAESSRPIRSTGRFTWCLFDSVLFPSCATRGRFDVPGVLVSGSGLSASACSLACGRFRGIALGPGAGFPFVSLPGGGVV